MENKNFKMPQKVGEKRDGPALKVRIPHVKLERESSLPRIEIERPSTPSTPNTPLRLSTPPLYTIPSRTNPENVKFSSKECEVMSTIPPHTKKLRMRSFLWVRPVTRSSVTAQLFAQLLPLLAINIAAFSIGLSMGYSAILLPQIRPELQPLEDLAHHYNLTSTRYRPFTADSEQGSWIASIFGIGAVFGGVFSAFIGKKYGRRVCILCLSIVDMIGWILIAASQNLTIMLVGRFLSGFVAAGYAPCIQIYVAEITQAKNRGWMLGLTVPIISIGTLVMYTLGANLPWHLAAATCTPVPLFLGIFVFFLNESPYWYFQQGDDKKAYAALEKFRGKDENCISESFQIQEHLKHLLEEVSFRQGLKKIFTEIKYLRPFLILNTLFLLMIFSGKFAIDFYAIDVLAKVGGSMDKHLAAVLVAIIQLVGALLFLVLVKKLSRKLLIVTSAFVMGTSLVVLGFCSYSGSSGGMEMMPELEWLPLTCVIVYMIAAPLGLCSIPFMYIAELYPAEMRSLLGGLTIALTNIELFVVVKTFPMLESILGDHATFWIYAGSCFLSIVFTLSYIPETKDKSLLQVEGKFERHRKPLRASPWISPIASPSVSSVRKLQFQTSMFTQ